MYLRDRERRTGESQSANAMRVSDIFNRYTQNIKNMPGQIGLRRQMVGAFDTGDYDDAAKAETRALTRKYSRSTYMGKNQG